MAQYDSKFCLKWIWALFFFFASLFLLSLPFRPYPLAPLVKSIPVFCLLSIALIRVSGVRKVLFAGALLFSGIGDILLEIGGKRMFLYGLGTFMAAHLFYIAAFFRRPLQKGAGRLSAAGMIAAFGVGMGFVLLPNLAGMATPIAGYLFIICAMGIAAALGRDNPGIVLAGACIFILSDAIIAVNRFLAPVPASSFWVMTTYYAAQSLIVAGVAKIGPPGPVATKP